MLYNEFNKSPRPKIRFSEAAAASRNVANFPSLAPAPAKTAGNVFTFLHFYVFVYLCFYSFVYLCVVFLPLISRFGSKTSFQPLKRTKKPRKSSFFDPKKIRLVCFERGGANNFTRFGVKLTVGQIFSGFKGTPKPFGNPITF
jgi:hypothetical protein